MPDFGHFLAKIQSNNRSYRPLLHAILYDDSTIIFNLRRTQDPQTNNFTLQKKQISVPKMSKHTLLLLLPSHIFLIIKTLSFLSIFFITNIQSQNYRLILFYFHFQLQCHLKKKGRSRLLMLMKGNDNAQFLCCVIKIDIQLL